MVNSDESWDVAIGAPPEECYFYSIDSPLASEVKGFPIRRRG